MFLLFFSLSPLSIDEHFWAYKLRTGNIGKHDNDSVADPIKQIPSSTQQPQPIDDAIEYFFVFFFKMNFSYFKIKWKRERNIWWCQHFSFQFDGNNDDEWPHSKWFSIWNFPVEKSNINWWANLISCNECNKMMAAINCDSFARSDFQETQLCANKN